MLNDFVRLLIGLVVRAGVSFLVALPLYPFLSTNPSSEITLMETFLVVFVAVMVVSQRLEK